MTALRILFLNYNVAFTGGGAFYRSWQWGRQLARRGHQVTVVATSPSGVLRINHRQQEGVTLVEMPGLFPRRWRYGYDIFEVARRLAWLRGRRYDIAHAIDCRPAVIYPALLAQRQGARLVIDWLDWFGRGGSVEQRANPLLRAVLRPVETYYEEAFRRRADATIVITPALEARARSLGVPPESITRIVHGADPDSLRPLDRAASRAALALEVPPDVPPGAPLLGYLGSLFAGDAALLGETFARVRAEFPTARLALIGSTKSAAPAGDGVLRAGFVDQKALGNWLGACDVMMLPLEDTVANNGRWPSKMMDYFAAGRPTAACDVGGVGDVLRQTGAGLAGPATAAALAEQALTLLRDPARAAGMGNAARAAAETDYSIAALTDRLEQVYQRLVERTSE